MKARSTVMTLGLVILGGASLFWKPGIAFGLGFVLFSILWLLPGYALARLLAPPSLSLSFAVLVGSLGYSMSSLLALGFLMILGMRPALLLVGLGLADGLIFLSQPLWIPRASTHRPAMNWNRTLAVLAVVLVFFVAVLQPILKIGTLQAHVRIYRPFFDVNYLKHLGVVGALTQGRIPPDNPYFHGIQLYYYWAFYLFPALAYRILGRNLAMGWILQALTAGMTLLGIGAIIGFLRNLTHKWTRWVPPLALMLFAYSYEGLWIGTLVHLKHMHLVFPWNNIDAATRLRFGPPEVVGIYRAFLYDPQHIFAMVLVLVAYQLYRRGMRTEEVRHGVLALLLAGGSVLHSAFIGFIGFQWFLLLALLHIQWTKDFLVHHKQQAILVGLGWMVYLFLALVHPALYATGRSTLELGLLKAVKTHAFGFFVLNFGSLLFTGLGGIVIGFLKRAETVFDLSALLAVCGIDMTLVHIPNWPNDIGLKAGYMAFPALAGLTVLLLESLSKFNRLKRIVPILILLAALPAIPTFVLDWYDVQATGKRLWEAKIRTSDIDAMKWIDRHLPETAVIQAAPVYENPAWFSIVPSFALRSTALGDPMHSNIFQVPRSAILSRKPRVHFLFVSRDVALVRQVACRLGVDYLYIGQTEIATYGPHLIDRIQAAHFPIVYHRDGNLLVRLVDKRKPCPPPRPSFMTRVVLCRPDWAVGHPTRCIPAKTPLNLRLHDHLVLHSDRDWTGSFLARVYSFRSRGVLKIYQNGKGLASYHIHRRPRWIEVYPLHLERGRNDLQLVYTPVRRKTSLSRSHAKSSSLVSLSDPGFFGRIGPPPPSP